LLAILREKGVVLPPSPDVPAIAVLTLQASQRGEEDDKDGGMMLMMTATKMDP
jgi:hypothetical protein